MYANRGDDSVDLINTLIERAITETAEDIGDQEVSPEQFRARADQRFEELTEPLRVGIDTFFAKTVSGTLIEVAERERLAGGGDAFSIEKVVVESMLRLERALGTPDDAEGARAGIVAYLYEVHCRDGSVA